MPSIARPAARTRTRKRLRMQYSITFSIMARGPPASVVLVAFGPGPGLQFLDLLQHLVGVRLDVLPAPLAAEEDDLALDLLLDRNAHRAEALAGSGAVFLGLRQRPVPTGEPVQ